MNRSIEVSKQYPAGTLVKVHHQYLNKYVIGSIVGSYSEERIGDLDVGVYVDVGDEQNYQYNLEYVQVVRDIRVRENPSENDFVYYDKDGKLTIIEKKSKNSMPIDMFEMVGYIRKMDFSDENSWYLPVQL